MVLNLLKYAQDNVNQVTLSHLSDSQMALRLHNVRKLIQYRSYSDQVKIDVGFYLMDFDQKLRDAGPETAFALNLVHGQIDSLVEAYRKAQEKSVLAADSDQTPQSALAQEEDSFAQVARQI